MNDSIVLRHILEGVIHNLNNPLNLVLGYAQILKKAHPDSPEVAKIYQAGIQMDDLLKDVVQKLWNNSFAAQQDLCLKSWLDGELEYLQNYLPIKHHVIFERGDTIDDAQLQASPLQLSAWYESGLTALLSAASDLKLLTGVCRYEGALALYIKVRAPEAFSKELKLESLADSEWLKLNKLRTHWDDSQRCLYGICP